MPETTPLFDEENNPTIKLAPPIEIPSPRLFHVPNIDIHLFRDDLAVANIAGSDPELSAYWLSQVVSNIVQTKPRRITFPAKDLDRLLSPRPPVNITLDAAAIAVGRALWARKFGWKPIVITRHRQRLLANSPRWPTGWRIEDAPWTAIQVLIKLDVHMDIDIRARELMAKKLAESGEVLASAGLSGASISIETKRPDLIESLNIPALAYAGEPGAGKYRLPLLASEPLLRVDGLDITDEAVKAIKRAIAKPRAVTMPDDFPWTLFPFQARDLSRAIRIVETAGGVLLAGDMGSGKLSSMDTPVLTPTGWTTMGDLRLGDLLVGSQGTPVRVTGIFPQGEQEIFQITLNDHSVVHSGDEHLWTVNTPLRRKRRRPAKTLTLKEIRTELRDAQGNLKHFLPIVKPVQFAPQPALPIDPYILGVILGDGTVTKEGLCRITSADPYLLEKVIQALPSDTHDTEKDNRAYKYRTTNTNSVQFLLDSLTSQQPTEHLSSVLAKKAWEKSIPPEYILASPNERHSIIQGLFDTNGCVAGAARSSVEYTTTSPRLAEQVVELIQSLGGIARLSVKAAPTYTYKGEKKTTRPCYRILINMPLDFPPFRTPNKADVYVPRVKYLPARAIQSVKSIGKKPAVCIQVDAEDGLYITEAYVPTHNTTVSLALIDHEEMWPALIIAPLAAISTWDRQLTEMGKNFYRAEEPIAVCKDKISNNNYDAVIVTYDRLHRLLEPMSGTEGHPINCLEMAGFACLVADEMQRIRTPGSRRSRALRSFAGSVPARIGMSGTPLTNSLMDVLAPLNVLSPGDFSPRSSTKDLSDVYPGDAAESLAEHLGSLMVRRRMEDTGVKLPGRTVKRVFVQLTADQRNALEALEAEARAAKEEGELGSHMHVFARLQKMRQIINIPDVAGVSGVNPKLEAAIDIAEEFASRNEKSIIFVNDRPAFRDVGKMLTAAGIGWTGIWGATSIPDRISNEHKYHTDPNCMVFLGTLAACGESLTLSPTARCTIFASLSYSPSVLAQAAARAYRMNTTHPVTEIYLSAQGPNGTLDDRMWELVTVKRELFAKIVDRTEYIDPAERTSLADLVFLITGDRDAYKDRALLDSEAEFAHHQAMKDHAKGTAHKRKGKNAEFIKDDGSIAKIMKDTDDSGESLADASLASKLRSVISHIIPHRK